MLRPLHRLAFAAAVATAAACGQPEDAANAPPPVLFEVFSFWETKGEKEAFEYIKREFEALHPNTDVRNAALGGGQQSQQIDLQERVYLRRPPHVFLANGGQGILEWVVFDRANTEEARLVQLEFAGDLLQGFFHPAAARAVRYRGAPFGVPLSIHRDNLLFYNPELFRELEVEPPRTLDDLLALCPVFAERGLIPLALGTKEDWTLHLLLEAVMIEVAGAEFYSAFWRGQRTSPQALATLDRVLERLLEVRGCLDPSADRWAWHAAVEQVVGDTSGSGNVARAAMAVMGDWAKGFLKAEGFRLGKDFDIAPFPGTERRFVMTVDAFAMLKGAPHPRLGTAFLKFIADPRIQLGFSRLKGSVPARQDVDDAGLDEHGRRTYRALAAEGTEVVYSIAMLLPQQVVVALDTALRSMFETGEGENVRLMIRNHLPRIREHAALTDL